MAEAATTPAPQPRKRSVLRIILLALLVIVVGLAIAISLQPDEFAVTRTETINAPPAVVFEQVNNFHNWPNWSPWENLDPNMKRTYEGPEAGQGAHYGWSGDGNVGEGHMTITESKPNEQIDIALVFLKPMEGTNPTVFTFTPDGEQTKVTWTMTGKMNFISKAMCLVISMDQMIGGMFEEGLAKMKSVSEAAAAKS